MEKYVYLSSYSTASAHLMKLPENEYSKTRRESLNVRRNPLGVVSSPSRAEHSSQQQQSRASMQPRTLSAVWSPTFPNHPSGFH